MKKTMKTITSNPVIRGRQVPGSYPEIMRTFMEADIKE